ncbi:hypothetical protein DdX_08098 [Ditylenchus destructor]|uniref:Uncharacterized protein n=1 Tax=Ditylenchus destructor TaxID=166010 RepID=A0AAD4N4H7_9BILA|nr:hypothetical protein DdX_08098 [Ditylenchus destructor]
MAERSSKFEPKMEQTGKHGQVQLKRTRTRLVVIGAKSGRIELELVTPERCPDGGYTGVKSGRIVLSLCCLETL